MILPVVAVFTHQVRVSDGEKMKLKSKQVCTLKLYGKSLHQQHAAMSK